HHVTGLEILEGDAPLGALLIQHLEDLPHAELVVREEPDLRLDAVELDGDVGALEVVALADLLERLIHRVVDFLEIRAGGDVERGSAGHAQERNDSRAFERLTWRSRESAF